MIKSDLGLVQSKIENDLKIPKRLIDEFGLNIEEFFDQIVLENDKSINFQDLQSIVRSYEVDSVSSIEQV